LISTIATVGGDEGEEEQQIKQRQRRISGDVRDGAAAARATVQAVRPTEHRRAEMREGGGGRVFFFR
jgi:hypothetical protein